MQLNEYQLQAMNYAIYPEQARVSYPLLGLVNEAGEVAGKFKKLMRDESSHFTEEGVMKQETRDAIVSELGDVLWYLSTLCTDLGVKLDDVANANITKLTDRAARGVIGGSGDTR